MTETAEYLPYLHLDDAFITGILSLTIGSNHVLWSYYRHVSNVVSAKLYLVWWRKQGLEIWANG